jgi:hypothetical protein
MTQRKYKTTTMEAILPLLNSGMQQAEIALTLNVCLADLRAACRVLGVRAHAPLADPRLGGWADRLERGETASSIAREAGLLPQRVYDMLKQEGLPTSCRAAILAKHARTDGVDIDAVHRVKA